MKVRNVKADSLASVFTDSTLSAFTLNAINKGVTDESIIYIVCNSSDAVTYGPQYVSGSHWIWAKGEMLRGDEDVTSIAVNSIEDCDLNLELQVVGLTEDEINSIINGIDLNEKYITFENGTDLKPAYRFPDGDVPRENNERILCFSKVNGVKCYVLYNGNSPWSNSTSTLTIGSTVYFSSDLSPINSRTITGGSEGFVIQGS